MATSKVVWLRARSTELVDSVLSNLIVQNNIVDSSYYGSLKRYLNLSQALAAAHKGEIPPQRRSIEGQVVLDYPQDRRHQVLRTWRQARIKFLGGVACAYPQILSGQSFLHEGWEGVGDRHSQPGTFSRSGLVTAMVDLKQIRNEPLKVKNYSVRVQ